MDYLDHYDIEPQQEKEQEAREECERQGLDPDEICADGGITAWMVVEQEIARRVLAIERRSEHGTDGKEGTGQ